MSPDRCSTSASAKNNVLPLDDRVAKRILPEIAGRPVLVKATASACSAA